MTFIKNIVIGLTALAVLFPVGFLDAARVSQLNVEDKGDFVLEPGKVEIFVNPGETVNRTISVINRINRKVTFKIETEDFVGSDNLNTPVILLGKDKSPYSFKDNLIAESDEFTLNFGQKMEMPIKIQVPENAQPGGYYSSVIVSSLPAEDVDGQAGARVISRVGALFFVRVNGPVDETGQLTDFRVAEDDSFKQKGPVKFEILFENTGTVHLVPYGQVVIRNIFGKQVATLPVDAYFSLPKSMRYREVTWEKESLLGRYTAELTLNRGYEGIEDVQKISFWVIPWSYLIGIFLIIVLLGLLWKFVSSRFEFKRKR